MAKKRANGEGSIRRKPNGRWEGRYTQGIDTSTGRAIQKSVSARTQAECKEKLAKAIRDNRGIPVNHNEDYTVAEWCRLWFETYSKPVIRPNTAKTYENMIENHIVPAIGGVKLKRLTAIQIQKMYNDSKTKGRVQRFEKKTDTALSGSTVRRIHMVLSSALKQAVKERVIPYNPCDNCRIPPKEKKEMAIIPPEKLGVYLSEAEKYGVLPMFFLELSSGLRRGELLALRWDDFDLNAGTVRIHSNHVLANGRVIEKDPKSEAGVRVLALGPKLTGELKKYRNTAAGSFVISKKDGTPYNPDSLSQKFRRFLERNDLPHIRLQDGDNPLRLVISQTGINECYRIARRHVKRIISFLVGHRSVQRVLDNNIHQIQRITVRVTHIPCYFHPVLRESISQRKHQQQSHYKYPYSHFHLSFQSPIRFSFFQQKKEPTFFQKGPTLFRKRSHTFSQKVQPFFRKSPFFPFTITAKYVTTYNRHQFLFLSLPKR